MEANGALEGYNSLPLRRKNCIKYRRASDVAICKAQPQERRMSSVNGSPVFGPEDCRFCIKGIKFLEGKIKDPLWLIS